MTVQELIDELIKIDDKSKVVIIDNPFFNKECFEIDDIENFEDWVTIWVE